MTATANEKSKWSLTNLPPQGHADVAEFAAGLFDVAKREKERLGKPKDWLSNYALYRGQDNSDGTKKRVPSSLVNLHFANIERTVSNITARKPTGEVVDLDGAGDQEERTLSVALEKWWGETNQQGKTRASARTMEIYGVVSEKPFWDRDKSVPGAETTDPFAFFPAPGNWENISEDAPYIVYAYLDFVDNIERKYGVKGVAEEEAYELLGQVREDYKNDDSGDKTKQHGNYEDPMTPARDGIDNAGPNTSMKRCLVLEIWCRDNREKAAKTEYAVVDPVTGQPMIDPNTGAMLTETESVKEKVYRDGVRMISITRAKDEADKTSKENKCGWMVLADEVNPNINPKLPDDLASTTHPWGRLPVYHANSYKDLISIWGFSAAEQTGDLLSEINTIIRRIVAYVKNVMTPPLIVQQHCGITRAMIESGIEKGGRLILMPTTPNARIEFMQIPNLPATFFQALELIVNFYDRVYQIEDADRGEAPRGVIAAAAIQALQERNQVLMQAKTTAIDNLVENRSRWAIGLWQNFGTQTDYVNVNGDAIPFIGAKYAGRKFNFTVEAGSTMPRTQLQTQEMAVKLFEMGAIDNRAVLEELNFPNWQQHIERQAEDQLGQIMQLLIEAGLPEDQAQELHQYLLENQGGPGDVQKPGQAATTAGAAEQKRQKQREGAR